MQCNRVNGLNNFSDLDSDNLMIEKFMNKILEFDIERKVKISKSDLQILFQNEEIKKMIEFFCDNVKSFDEISKTKAMLRYFTFNQDSLQRISSNKEKRYKLKNELINKKNLLKALKEKKQEILSKKILMIDNLRQCQKEEEKYFIKSKILKNSNLKLNKFLIEYNDFKLLDEYKILKKTSFEANTIEIDEKISFEMFFEENHKLFMENFAKENYKKIPKYPEDILKRIYNLCSIEDFTKKIDEKLKFINLAKRSNKDKDQNQGEHILYQEKDEFLLKYEKILFELKSQIEKDQLEIIAKYKNENILEEIEKIRFDNENLIKTFKIPENILKRLKEITNIKLIEDVEYLLKKEKLNKEDKIDFDHVQFDKNFTSEIDNNSVLNMCKTKINLFKKYKNRIDNFTIRHVMPLSLHLEENFNDFHNSLKTEFDYFKKFELIHLKELTNHNETYSLKRFNYDKEFLRNSEIRKKSNVFKIFFEFLDLFSTENHIRNMEFEIRKNTFNNPIYRKLCLIFGKFNEIKIFISKEYLENKEKVKENWNNLKFILYLLAEKIKFYVRIFAEWSRQDFIIILKNIYTLSDK